MEKLENESVAADEKVQAAKTAMSTSQAKLQEQDKKLEEVAATDKACEDAKKAEKRRRLLRKPRPKSPRRSSRTRKTKGSAAREAGAAGRRGQVTR